MKFNSKDLNGASLHFLECTKNGKSNGREMDQNEQNTPWWENYVVELA
jgi:hypothetical protein